MQLIARLDAGLPSAFEAEEADAKRLPERRMPRLAWQTTVGRMWVDIGEGGYAPYLARQADLELHREATSLALNVMVAGVAPPERAAWLAQQPMSPYAQGRLVWAEGGRELTATMWQTPNRHPQDSLRIRWP